MSWKLSKKIRSGSKPETSGPSSTLPPSSNPAPRFIPHAQNPRGVLSVILHEGAGLSAQDLSQKSFPGRRHQNENLALPIHGVYSLLPYALLDYDRSQAVTPSIWGTIENPRWFDKSSICQFDVARATDLIIHLYLRCMGTEDNIGPVPLGMVSLNPFQGTTVLGSQWLQVQDGTGRLRISLDYTSIGDRVSKYDESDFELLGISGKSLRLRKEDTKRYYVQKRLRFAELDHLSPAIHHPFIVSLAFALQTPNGVRFFTPFMSGGHLLNHLQRLQCFNVSTCRFYAASIVCALDYLHATCSAIPLLKPGHVLLDARGYIVLCGSNLLSALGNSAQVFERELPEYPAPELLGGQGVASPSANWWTLGVLLYEMLTGMPPFYDENNEKRRQNILDRPVHFPNSMEPTVIDLLSKLLDRDPENRLGTGGTLSIKAHPFFHTVDWQRLLFRKYEAPFMPGYVADTFKHNGLGPAPEPERPLDQYRDLIETDPAPTEPEAKSRTQNQEALGSNESIAKHGDRYELEWDNGTRTLYFRNLDTNTREHVLAPATEGARCEVKDSRSASAIFNSPDSAQKHAALEIALDIGDRRIISQLLDYGMDLNIQIVVKGENVTPLECAVQQGAVDLVTWFLEKSTPKINRVAGTRALGLAVDSRNIAVVEALLANGIRCDFEDADRPAPRNPNSGGCEFYDVSDPEGFLSPLVRAVRHGDVELTRLLLKYGADPNVGYHDLPFRLEQIIEGEVPGFSCGRAVQLALELKYADIMRLLLSSGSDVNLGPPVWYVVGHWCGFPSRPVYHRVMHGLRSLSG